LWTNGWMDEAGTSHGGRPRPTRHCVRCEPSYPQKKGMHTLPYPIFGPCLLWPDGWMDEDAAWYGSRPRPRPHCTRRGPSSRKRGTAAPPLFLAHVYCGHGRQSLQLLLSSCFIILDGPREVLIGRSAPERAWLEDGDVLTCTADSSPPATYDWTELTTGVHLHKGAELVVDVCRLFSVIGWNVTRREVVLLCSATGNNHSDFSNITATLHRNKLCAGLLISFRSGIKWWIINTTLCSKKTGPWVWWSSFFVTQCRKSWAVTPVSGNCSCIGSGLYLRL